MLRTNRTVADAVSFVAMACIATALCLAVVASGAEEAYGHDCMQLGETEVCMETEETHRAVAIPCNMERAATKAIRYPDTTGFKSPDDAHRWVAEYVRYAWQRYARCLEGELRKQLDPGT